MLHQLPDMPRKGHFMSDTDTTKESNMSTDHKDEATFTLEQVEPLAHESPDSTRIALAQVHATLAVAEQQRIASLIAIWQVLETSSLIAESVDGALFNFVGGGRAWKPEIATALGLTVTS